MNTKHFIPAALIALAGIAGSASAVAGPMSNEISDMPASQSTLTRAQVAAETRAWMKQGHFERTSYDEQESVAVARQRQDQQTESRAQVMAETRAFYKAHPNAEYESDTYGIGG